MRQPHRPPRSRATLRVEQLEDRSTPTTIAADRVVVAFATTNPAVDHHATLAAASFATKIEPLGFGIYRVELNQETDATTAANFYAASPDVTAVAPDRIVRVERTANDPGVAENWALARIDAPAAWDRQTGTRNTIVAVIDSGIDASHPDLAANLWINPSEQPGNGQDDDGNGFIDDVHGVDFAASTGDPRDDDGHGTHIAGVIGAVGGNGIGGAGVNWNTRIMALRFLTAEGTGYTSDAVRALAYAAANGAKVANLSWGGPDPDPTLAEAIHRAREAGLIVVAAAGNDGRNTDAAPFYPAAYRAYSDNVVVVAASDRTDALAGFSNFGPQGVTLAAPGLGIPGTLPNGRYAALSGTSVATPFVAGAIALLWDQNPDWDYRQVLAKLLESVDVIPALAGRTISGGRLNLARMLDPQSSPVIPPVIPPTPPATSGPIPTHAYFAGATPGTFDRARLTFSNSIDLAAVTAAFITLTGPAGSIPVLAITTVAGSNQTRYDVTFASQSQAGWYSIVVGDGFSRSAALADVPPPPVAPATPARVAFSSSNGPVAIPDQGIATVTVEVSTDLIIADLDIQLAITHTYIGDLLIQLTAPDGQTVILANRRGGSGDDFINTALDDTAGSSLIASRAPYRGTFRPDEPLALFHGANARGTWTLTVTDRAAKDIGRITGMTLNFASASSGVTRRATFESKSRIAFWHNVSQGIEMLSSTSPRLRPETRSVMGWDNSPKSLQNESKATVGVVTLARWSEQTSADARDEIAAFGDELGPPAIDL